MQHEVNPFLQHAVRHGQMAINASNRAVATAGGLVQACDEIVFNINNGNMPGALASAQNARNMAVQVADATQYLNQAINERMNMASYVLGRIQQHINEMAGALQGIRGTEFIPAGHGYQGMQEHYHA